MVYDNIEFILVVVLLQNVSGYPLLLEVSNIFDKHPTTNFNELKVVSFQCSLIQSVWKQVNYILSLTFPAYIKRLAAIPIIMPL